jgi:hypothetical protein
MCGSQEEDEVHTGFWWANLRGRRGFGYLGEDGRIILKNSSRKIWSLAWINLAQDRDR